MGLFKLLILGVLLLFFGFWGLGGFWGFEGFGLLFCLLILFKLCLFFLLGFFKNK